MVRDRSPVSGGRFAPLCAWAMAVAAVVPGIGCETVSRAPSGRPERAREAAAAAAVDGPDGDSSDVEGESDDGAAGREAAGDGDEGGPATGPDGGAVPDVDEATGDGATVAFEQRTTGRGVAVRQPGTDLWWLRCHRSSGFAFCSGGSWREALAGCPDGWRLPTREEMVSLLDGCPRRVREGGAGSCLSCALSESCRAIFGRSDGPAAWTSTMSGPPQARRAWVVWLVDGSVADNGIDDSYGAPCVRSGSPDDDGAMPADDCAAPDADAAAGAAEEAGAGCGPSRLSVISRPPTEVFLDGERIRWTPVINHAVTVGRHTLRLVNRDAGVDDTTRFSAEAGRTLFVRRLYEGQEP